MVFYHYVSLFSTIVLSNNIQHLPSGAIFFADLLFPFIFLHIDLGFIAKPLFKVLRADSRFWYFKRLLVALSSCWRIFFLIVHISRTSFPVLFCRLCLILSWCFVKFRFVDIDYKVQM